MTQLVTLNFFLQPMYNVFRKDRKSCGGGTLIAVKSNLPTRELEITTTLECVAVEINLSPEKTLLLINCYRPPSDQKFFHDLKDVIANFLLDKYWSALIVGDFNYRIFRCISRTCV